MESKNSLCCRICLNTDCKLMPMKPYGLHGAYELILGTSLQHDDGLPRELCVECATLLDKYHKFRDKCHEANGLLYNMELNNCASYHLKVKQIKQTRSEIEKLHSTLNFNKLVAHLDILPEPSVKMNDIFEKETFFKDNTGKVQSDNCNEVKINKIEPVDETIEVQVDLPPGDEDWLDETSDLKIDFDDDDDDDYVSHPRKTKTVIKKKKKSPIKKGSNKTKSIKSTNKDNSKDKLKQKLIKLLEKDNLDEDEQLKGLKRRNSKLSEHTLNLIKLRKNRYELVNECFVKKTMLSLEEQRDSFEKMKLDDSYVNANYKCELCYKGLVTEQYLQNHIQKYHSKSVGEFECQLCKMRFKTEKSLLTHMKCCHVNEYQCKSCDASFTNIFTAETHATFHKGVKFVCQHCGEKYDSRTVYLSHVRLKHAPDHICVYCGYSFIGEKGLNQHIKRKHKEHTEFADVPCAGCPLRFASQPALEVHVRVKHPPAGDKPRVNGPSKGKDANHRYYPKYNIKFPVPCESCGVEMSSGKEYIAHFKEAHPNMKRTFILSQFHRHICDKCGRGFHAKSVLLDHMLVHESACTVPCPKCPSRFKTAVSLRYHLQTHDRPVDCHVCGLSVTRSNLKRHVKVKHTEGMNFECELCGKRFKTRGEVKPHIKHVHMNIPWPRKRTSTDGPSQQKRRKF